MLESLLQDTVSFFYNSCLYFNGKTEKGYLLDVHYVVTEYGYAYLFGKNLTERAQAMIQIAHPDHREQLEKLAFERYHIAPFR